MGVNPWDGGSDVCFENDPEGVDQCRDWLTHSGSGLVWLDPIFRGLKPTAIQWLPLWGSSSMKQAESNRESSVTPTPPKTESELL